MGWQEIRDRKKLMRAGRAVGADLDALWEYVPDQVGGAVHTRAFLTIDGRTGWLYTDGHIDWDHRDVGPWSRS
jgi:hypothetical protein